MLAKRVGPLREHNYYIKGRKTKNSNDFYLVDGEKLESATFTFTEEYHLEAGEYETQAGEFHVTDGQPELKIIKFAHLRTKCDDVKKHPLCRSRRLLAGNIHTSATQTPNNTETFDTFEDTVDVLELIGDSTRYSCT